jgi:hypothetical protein
MQTQAITRRLPTQAPSGPAAPARAAGIRRFNPTEFKNDFLDLVKVNPGLAADTATKIAEQRSLQNRELNAASSNTADFVAFLLSTGVVALVGAWDGSIQAKRNKIIAGWETAGLVPLGQEPDPAIWKAQAVKEPGTVLGQTWIRTVGVPVLFGGLAVLSASMRDESDPASWYERTFAVSAISTWGLAVAGWTRSAGYRWQEKRDSAPAAQAA